MLSNTNFERHNYEKYSISLITVIWTINKQNLVNTEGITIFQIFFNSKKKHSPFSLEFVQTFSFL